MVRANPRNQQLVVRYDEIVDDSSSDDENEPHGGYVAVGNDNNKVILSDSWLIFLILIGMLR